MIERGKISALRALNYSIVIFLQKYHRYAAEQFDMVENMIIGKRKEERSSDIFVENESLKMF
jgi:hypothetical protein